MFVDCDLVFVVEDCIVEWFVGDYVIDCLWVCVVYVFGVLCVGL